MQKTKIVGILNITPNSFSDGGKFLSFDDAMFHAAKLISDGADVIDVGAESTAPGVTAVSQSEEWSRIESILPGVIKVAHEANVEVSIDTRNAKTAALAVEAGVDYVNDQGGLMDLDMPFAVKERNTRIVVMHNYGIPVSPVKTVVGSPEDVMKEVMRSLQSKVSTLLSHGIPKSNIIVDPGIGFGKPPEYSWYLIKNICKFKELGLPIYVGHSRKSMFSALSIKLEDRDVPTSMVSAYLMQQGIDFVRVHDVALTRIAREISSRL